MRSFLVILAFAGLAALAAPIPAPSYARVPILASSEPTAFWVDATDSVVFVLPSARADLRLIYTDPLGQVWDTAAPTMEATEGWEPPDPTLLPGEAGTLYHAGIDKPATGRWTLAIQMPPPEEVLKTQLVVFYKNRVSAAMTVPKATLVSGQSLNVTLTLMDGTAKVQGLQVTSLLLKTDEPVFPAKAVAFYDDGTHGDPKAKDGSYTLMLPAEITGTFHIETTVEGTASTGHCQRSCGLDFKVVAQAARLTGNVVQHLRAGTPE
jgi:hypothetical protein